MAHPNQASYLGKQSSTKDVLGVLSFLLRMQLCNGTIDVFELEVESQLLPRPFRIADIRMVLPRCTLWDLVSDVP